MKKEYCPSLKGSRTWRNASADVSAGCEWATEGTLKRSSKMSLCQKWDGRWNDGKTPQSHYVEIELHEDYLKFSLKNPASSQDTMPEFWSYENIHSPTPIAFLPYHCDWFNL